MIAGEGDLEASLRGAIQSLGLAPAATFVGTVPRPDLARLMSAADVLVITSVFETGPTVGLEALACGLPVITTAVGEVSRVVAEARVGHVADGRDPDDLGRGIESVLGRRRDELRVACLAAAATFTAERVLGELYDYNRSLAARLRPG